MNIRITVVVQKEENWYVAKCLENNVAYQGKAIEEALDNLKEAIALFYDDEKQDLVQKSVFLTTMEIAI